jgi:hypothetical protein
MILVIVRIHFRFDERIDGARSLAVSDALTP